MSFKNCIFAILNMDDHIYMNKYGGSVYMAFDAIIRAKVLLLAFNSH